MPWETELGVALRVARRAADLIRTEYVAFTPIPDAPVSISTEVDRASQQLILDELHRAFPTDALAAEEATTHAATIPTTGERLWIVDPIDGTRGFAMKNGEFSVMIGLVFQGTIVVGVVAEPALDRITYASQGGGCWSQDGDGSPHLCRVTSTPTLADAVLVQSHAKQPPSPGAAALKPRRVRETYSAGVKSALVARGEVDLYFNDYPKFSDWDICAGEILVTEAGGAVSDSHGRPIRYGLAGHRQGLGLLASNGLIHDEALRALTAAGLRVG